MGQGRGLRSSELHGFKTLTEADRQFLGLIRHAAQRGWLAGPESDLLPWCPHCNLVAGEPRIRGPALPSGAGPFVALHPVGSDRLQLLAVRS